MKATSTFTKFTATIAFLAVIYVNYLANALPINGMTTGALSALYPNLFVPAGITFSIWGLIYLSLCLLTVYVWKRSDSWANKSWAWGLIATHLFNILWILTWHYQWIFVSVLVMVLFLSTLLAIYLQVVQDPVQSKFGIIRMTLGLYTSWICVALIANITALLVSRDLQSGLFFSEEIWTILMISAAVIISSLMTYRFGDPFFGSVTVWALLGIFIRNQNAASGVLMSIYWVTLIGMVVMSLVILITVMQKKAFKLNTL